MSKHRNSLQPYGTFIQKLDMGAWIHPERLGYILNTLIAIGFAYRSKLLLLSQEISSKLGNILEVKLDLGEKGV